jgi:hypothetical protein
MTEPREFSEYLDEVSRALRGRRKRRQEIIEELRCHLLDELEETLESEPSARSVLYQFGSSLVIADGFNEVRRAKRLRFARSALAVTTLSTIGGYTTQKALAPAGDEISRPAVRVQSKARSVPGMANVIAVDPTTGKVVLITRHA